ncbi:DNA polymerase III subunit delta [Candidatus Xenohaliotis californiensis]|uniref:DNA-directed DNA polymerase n=1 Tax=Candidatus Xenohaliotis californiensis TaxID=84677 RepID=A0ABM9N7X3_9RICK|nr:DNA polymerase III subunit delta [Candidatus Xenohaliotis californiensis]
MKIKKTEVKNFLNSLQCYKGVLLYGQDLGKVEMLLAAIVKNLNNFVLNNTCVAKLEYNSILQDPSLLELELCSLDFFASNALKIVVVYGAVDFASKQLLKLLDKMEFSKSYIIFLAGSLSAKSTLRFFCEKSAKFASIPCYTDSIAELRKLLDFLLRSYNLQCSESAKKAIVSAINGDRLLMESEVKKLSLYADGSIIEESDVKKCCIAYSQDGLSDLCIKLADKDTSFFVLLDGFVYKGVKVPTIIRYLQNYFSQMLKIQCFIERGESFENAIAMMNPPIFFHLANAIKRQLSFWSMDYINKIIRILLSMEIDDCKMFHKIDIEILSFFAYRVFSNNLDLKPYSDIT